MVQIVARQETWRPSVVATPLARGKLSAMPAEWQGSAQPPLPGSLQQSYAHPVRRVPHEHPNQQSTLPTTVLHPFPNPHPPLLTRTGGGRPRGWTGARAGSGGWLATEGRPGGGLDKFVIVMHARHQTTAGEVFPVPDEQYSRQPCAIDRIKNEDAAGREDTRNLSNRCLQIAYMFQCIDKSPRQQRQSTYWAG